MLKVLEIASRLLFFLILHSHSLKLADRQNQ